MGQKLRCSAADDLFRASIGIRLAGGKVILQGNLLHLLHDVHPNAAAEAHTEAQLFRNMVGRAGGGMAGIIIQAQREGIDRGGIGADGLGQRKLPGEVGEIGRTGVAES